MGDFNEQICRLCLVISPTCECEVIEEIKKEIFQILQINIDFDVSDCAVACNGCLKRLKDCFDFKSHVMTTLMDIKIKKSSQRQMIGESLCPEKVQVCQLCISLIKDEAFNYATDLKGAIFLKDMIRVCFAEVDLNFHVRETLICKQCVKSLERYYEFMRNCEEVEQKIVHFCQVADHCIADKVNLGDMLKFKNYEIPGTPIIIIKKEYSGAGNDEIATKCSESEDIANIKCEEILIKDELENGAEQSGSYQLDDHDSLHGDGSSKWKGDVGKCEPEEKYNSCPKCPYSTKRLHNLRRHIRTHSENKQLCCVVCSFVTDARLLLHAHMRTHRGATKRYGCRECSYETDYRNHLEQHNLKHRDIPEVEMHKCLSCPYKSKYKAGLVNHQKMQHGKIMKAYKCQECSFITKYRHCLANHHVVHADPKVAKKFKCDKCPFRTKWQWVVKRHMKIHDKQLHGCDQCTGRSKRCRRCAAASLNTFPVSRFT